MGVGEGGGGGGRGEGCSHRLCGCSDRGTNQLPSSMFPYLQT